MFVWSPIIAGYATLKDMQTFYTMDDLADMLEAIALKQEIERRVTNKRSK